MSAAKKIGSELWHEESGQTLVLVAVTMTLLLGFVALAVDVGMMFVTRRSAQTAADAGAIAAAQELSLGTAAAAARTDAALNGYTNGSNGVTVTMNNPPTLGSFAGNANYSEVIVDAVRPTVFLNAFKIASETVRARAVATFGPTQNCIWALSPIGIDLNLSNGVAISLPGCAVFANSTSPSDLSIVGGASLSAAAINLVGGSTLNNGGISSVLPTTGIASVPDPLASLPTPTFTMSSCVANPNLGGGGTFTIGPANGGTICYNGLTIANGATATLRPGFYIVNGQFSIAGGSTVSGTGVTLYFPPGGSVALTNGINFSLTAPTSGTYNGILFYQNRSNLNPAYVEGGASSTLKGILYFPSANVTFENGTNTTSFAAIIASTLTFAGGAVLNNYSTVNPSSPLDGVRIVE